MKAAIQTVFALGIAVILALIVKLIGDAINYDLGVLAGWWSCLLFLRLTKQW